ncbi:MFS transporter [Modestobacter muralis]|uniref:MFS transporter n=1 Tax=Modestobacter muralis TaxID=1608614 RepID=A0A6P0H7Z7_9ACTN|nr:MFS transporter [Modestobacter muralis]NEK95120.1 MFS transporter [Modestobacter muralis]NEN52008.1 MFS transporter [Modestobacter muralis]
MLSTAATAALLTVIGVSVGFTNLGLQTALYDTAPPDDAGVAAGLVQTSRSLGTVLSASLLGVVFGDEIDTASLHQPAWRLAAVSALVLALDLRPPVVEPLGLRPLIIGSNSVQPGPGSHGRVLETRNRAAEDRDARAGDGSAGD